MASSASGVLVKPSVVRYGLKNGSGSSGVMKGDSRACNSAAMTITGRLAAAPPASARMYERSGDRARAADELEAYLKQNPSATNAAAIRDSIAKLRTP